MVSLLGLRIGQFDQYDMGTDTFWSIYDISYDIYMWLCYWNGLTFMLSRYSYSMHLIMRWYETQIEYTIVEIFLGDN